MSGCNYVVGDHGWVEDSFEAEMDDLDKHLELMHGIIKSTDLREEVKSMLREQGAVFDGDEEEEEIEVVKKIPEEEIGVDIEEESEDSGSDGHDIEGDEKDKVREYAHVWSLENDEEKIYSHLFLCEFCDFKTPEKEDLRTHEENQHEKA